jgi:hypothetical protein
MLSGNISVKQIELFRIKSSGKAHDFNELFSLVVTQLGIAVMGFWCHLAAIFVAIMLAAASDTTFIGNSCVSHFFYAFQVEFSMRETSKLKLRSEQQSSGKTSMRSGSSLKL